MRLRLYHHTDGARVAYRQAGTGRVLVLLHSLRLSHREFEPVIDTLADRFRVVVPDLPLHGDSEDRPSHPYTTDWFAEVLAGFCAEIAGPGAALVGHNFGAELALKIVGDGLYAPSRLVVLNNRLDAPVPHRVRWQTWRAVASLGALPGLDVVLSHGTKLVFRPAIGQRLSSQSNPAAADLVRHAFSDVPGNGARARAWAKFARHNSGAPQPGLVERAGQASEAGGTQILLLWADQEPGAPLEEAQQQLDRLTGAQLRTLPGAGFLVAYDDPVNLARELIAFCG